MLLVVCTFALICIGALVTTARAGLAVPDWPTTFGYGMFTYPLGKWWYGPYNVLVEHGHRLMGSVVGLVTIALVALVWWFDQRSWVRTLSVICLVAVIAQGVLGGLRVNLRSTPLALIHGCSAQAFFALTVATSVFLSRRWRQGEASQHDQARKLHTLALLTCVLAYLQIVLGAVLRHTPSQAAVYFHWGLAAVLAVHIGLLVFRIWRQHRAQPALTRPASFLAVLILAQLFFGLATWVAKYGGLAGYRVVAYGPDQTWTTTAHVATGGLIFVTLLVVSLRALRLTRRTNDPAPSSAAPQMAETAS